MIIIALLMSFASAVEGTFQFSGGFEVLNPMKLESAPIEPQMPKIIFGTIKSLEPVMQQPGLLKYEVQQSVQVGEHTYSSATYYETKDFVKVIVGSSDQKNFYAFTIRQNAITLIEVGNIPSLDQPLWVEFYFEKVSELP